MMPIRCILNLNFCCSRNLTRVRALVQTLVRSLSSPVALFQSLVLSLTLAIPIQGFAQESTLIPKAPSPQLRLEEVNTWKKLEAETQQIEAREKTEGIAYMVSGALIVIAGGVGYSNAQNNFERFAFTLSQSIGVGGIGYGAFQYFVGSDPRSFVSTVEGVPSLTIEQKDLLAKNYVTGMSEHKRRDRIIRIVAHALVAGINLYQASREPDDWTKAALSVVGGANALAVISLSF